MAKPFTGEEFAQALSSGTLKESVVLAGMAKKSDDDPQVILFSPGMSCLHWIPIPVKMIDKVDHLGQVPCKDHTHHSVRITLKEPSSPETIVLGSLLVRYTESESTGGGQLSMLGGQSLQGFPRQPMTATPPQAMRRLFGHNLNQDVREQDRLQPAERYTSLVPIYNQPGTNHYTGSWGWTGPSFKIFNICFAVGGIADYILTLVGSGRSVPLRIGQCTPPQPLYGTDILTPPVTFSGYLATNQGLPPALTLSVDAGTP